MVRTPKVTVKMTRYQRGAVFERKVLSYLRGDDNTEATTGYLHSLIPAIYATIPVKTLPPEPRITGIRVAGSKGDYDLYLYTAWPHLHGSAVLGVQCKIVSPAHNRIISELKRSYAATGIAGVYAVRVGRKMVFVPHLDEIYATLIQGVLGE